MSNFFTCESARMLKIAGWLLGRPVPSIQGGNGGECAVLNPELPGLLAQSRRRRLPIVDSRACSLEFGGSAGRSSGV